MKLLKKIENLFSSESERTSVLKKNIFYSIINKGLSVAISLLLFKYSLDYLGQSDYGIWLTLSSVIGWMSFLDFGLSHGLRNKFSEAKANGDTELAKQYISTSYFGISVLFAVLAIILLATNYFFNWSGFLNQQNLNTIEIRNVFYILICSFSIQFILNVITTIISADQKAAFAAFINTIGQLFVFFGVLCLTYFFPPSLVALAAVVTIFPCFIYFIFTVVLFRSIYKAYLPSVNAVNVKLIKDLFTLGGKFFIIQLSMIFVFQLINIITLRILGPEAVTKYNIVNKYFSISSMLMIIVITPFWSAFTDAYTKYEFSWMHRIYHRISKMWLLFIPLTGLMVLLAPFIYKIWIGKDMSVPFSLSVLMGIYTLLLTRANLSMYLINGTGKVLIQMIIYLIFGIVSVPLMVLFTKLFGLNGLMIILIAVTLIQCIFGEIQIRKIINRKDCGIWAK